jgi:flagellar biosynthetic protein FliR
MNWAEIFSETYIIGFILLFFRFSSLFLAVPIFSHKNIPINIKISMAFFFSVIFYSSMPPLVITIDFPTILLAVLSEFLFGLSIGIVLLLSYHAITFAGEQISFVMGFSLASTIDPQTGVSMPVVSQFLSLLGVMILFVLNMHHWLLIFINNSLSAIPLGGFVISHNLFDYIIKATSNMFMVGFMIAFPVIAISWLCDIVFGMLVKTMPQFNLLVIGFPVKIIFAFIVLIFVLGGSMLTLQEQMKDTFSFLIHFLEAPFI